MAGRFPEDAARLRTSEGLIKGGGVLACDRHVLTCAHVVYDALGLPRQTRAAPDREIALDLPFLGPSGRGLRARVAAWRPMAAGPAADGPSVIAVLEILGEGRFPGSFGPDDVERRPPGRGTPLAGPQRRVQFQ